VGSKVGARSNHGVAHEHLALNHGEVPVVRRKEVHSDGRDLIGPEHDVTARVTS
jgi:hypothetical protein